ncbi:MAG: MlaD family protein [Planctomycetota bacterium]|nr:MlaD family protein [Planctomycetota bacterium]
MRDSQRDFLIGLCSIIATAALVALLVLFGEIKTTGGWTFEVRTKDAAGLRSGSTVTLNGVLAGQISKVQLVEDDTLPVELTISVDNTVTIPRDVRFLVRDSLLGNSGQLAMITSGWSPDMPAISTGDVVRVDRIPSRMMTELGEEMDRRLGTLLSSWTSVGEHLNILLGDDASDERTIASAIRQFNRLLDSTIQWVDNPALRQNAEALLQKMPAVMDRAIGATEELTRLARTLDLRSDEVGREMAETARQLRELLDSSNRLVTAMREGDGTIGQLVENPDLYESLEAAAKRLDQLLVDFQLMIQQIREEGIGPLL